MLRWPKKWRDKNSHSISARHHTAQNQKITVSTSRNKSASVMVSTPCKNRKSSSNSRDKGSKVSKILPKRNPLRILSRIFLTWLKNQNLMMEIISCYRALRSHLSRRKNNLKARNNLRNPPLSLKNNQKWLHRLPVRVVWPISSSRERVRSKLLRLRNRPNPSKFHLRK